jgi:hypothetical protein
LSLFAMAAVCLIGLGALIASRFDGGPPATFQVVVRVQPTDAELRLDGAPVAGSTVAIELPRDGRLHLLEASAAGHRPASVSFRDRAPPPRLVLERLPPEPPPATAEADPASAEPADVAAAPASPLPTDTVAIDEPVERRPPRGGGPRRPPPAEPEVRYGANKAPVIR